MTKNDQKMTKNDQKMTKNVQKVSQNVKKSQNATKKSSQTKKVYSEDQICKIACMVFMLESQVARLCAASGCFLGDEMSKHEFLKEYMAVDRTMRRLSKDFHKEIEETIGKFRVFADDGKQVSEIKDGGVYASDND